MADQWLTVERGALSRQRVLEIFVAGDLGHHARLCERIGAWIVLATDSCCGAHRDPPYSCGRLRRTSVPGAPPAGGIRACVNGPAAKLPDEIRASAVQCAPAQALLYT